MLKFLNSVKNGKNWRTVSVISSTRSHEIRKISSLTSSFSSPSQSTLSFYHNSLPFFGRYLGFNLKRNALKSTFQVAKMTTKKTNDDLESNASNVTPVTKEDDKPSIPDETNVEVRIEVVSTFEDAQNFPLFIPPGVPPSPPDMHSCEKCQKPFQPIIMTTWNPDNMNLWSTYPLAIDALQCRNCDLLIFPRTLIPEEQKFLIQRAVFNAKHKKYDVAEFFFRRAANNMPSNHFMHINLGNFYFDKMSHETKGMNLKNFKENHSRLSMIAKWMLNSYEIAIHLKEPQVPNFVWLQIARVNKQIINDFKASTEAFEKYLNRLKNEPSTPDNLSNQTEIQEEIKENNLVNSIIGVMDEIQQLFQKYDAESLPKDEKSIPKFFQLFEELPQTSIFYPKIFQFRAFVLQNMGQYEEAYSVYKQVHQKYDNVVDVSKELAAEAIRIGEVEEAIEYSKLALERHPNDPQVESNAALGKLIAGDVEGAHELGKIAYNKDPKNPITRNAFKLIKQVKSQNIPIEQFLSERFNMLNRHLKH